MSMRTEQDKINRKEANQRYYKLEENKEQKRDYMKEYSKRDYVKVKAHEYYTANKMHWGEKKKKKWGGMRQENEEIKRLHEKWARENGYRDNDLLNIKNTERFINDAKK
jgi:hypothetical protein